MGRNNKSPKVSFTLTDLTTMLRNVVRGNGKTPKTGVGTFQYTTNNGEYVEMEGGTITPLPTTTTTTTEEPTTTTTTTEEVTTTTTTEEPTTTTTTEEPTTTTTTIDYTVLPYQIITSRNVESFPGSTLPSSYIFDLKDSNGDFVYSDYDIKCIVESIPNGGYGSWTIGVENNSDEYLSVGDSDLVRFNFAGTEVVGLFNQSARGYYIDTETRFGNTIDKYIIDIVNGEVISIVSFDSIGDVSGCNLPTETTTTTTVAPTTTTTTTVTPTITTTTTDDGLYEYFMSEPVLTEAELCNQSFNLRVKHSIASANNWVGDFIKNMDGSTYYLPNSGNYFVVVARADLSPSLYNQPVSSANTTPVSPGVYISQVRIANYQTYGAKGIQAYGWYGSNCPAPTTTTTTTVAPTTTTTTTMGPTVFNWVVSTDVNSNNRISYVEENLDNDPYNVWSNSPTLTQLSSQGLVFNYFPVEAGQSYYLRLENNNPNGFFRVHHILGKNSSGNVYLTDYNGPAPAPLTIHSLTSVWNASTDSTRPDVSFENTQNESVNQCAYDSDGLVKIYNKVDTNNGTTSTVCDADGYLWMTQPGNISENYVKIDVPSNANTGEEFTIGWNTLQYYEDPDNTVNGAWTPTDVRDFFPTQSLGSIQFRVIPTTPIM